MNQKLIVNMLKKSLSQSNEHLIRECAEILESMKQLSEAAQLYESSAYYDKVRIMIV